MTRTETSAEVGTRVSRKRGISFFNAKDAQDLDDTDMMSPPDISLEILEQVDLAPLAVGRQVKVLFRPKEEGGPSLVSGWFAPNFPLPRHSHSADCLYYVVSGQAILGSRVVDAGSGFYVPKDAPYSYRAGPEGVEILEFRNARSFDMKIADRSVDSWRSMVAIAMENSELWRAANRDNNIPYDDSIAAPS
jgi:hypothetical protein